MKKMIAVLAALMLLCGYSISGAFAEAEGIGEAFPPVTYDTFFADLLNAYNAVVRIDEDTAALNDEVADAVAAHWKKVYLDEYKLYRYGADDPADLPIAGAHAFVVLGYQLENGEMTNELKGRCDAAAAAALAFPDSILVCTGGATGANNPERHTEAGLMKAYLTERWGIAPERIFTDESAMTTAENAVNTLAILREQGVETMTLVTSAYHQRWGQVLYNALAAQYKQKYGYSAEIVGNYCLDIEPENPFFQQDARIALMQLGNVLDIPAVRPVQRPAVPADGDRIPYWTEGSKAAGSILAFVNAVTDEDSPDYIAPADRIAVFDFDGTLFGELFPTYFDTCLFLHRALHDDAFTAAEDVAAYAAALEDALAQSLPEPESPRSTAQMAAECFSGMAVEEYRAYVRDFMGQPVPGFQGMTYGKGFYQPMTALVRYLSERGFTVFISSGSERALVRELIRGTLDEWIPPYRVIGSVFSLCATGQGEKAGRSYTYAPDDEVLLEGNLAVKNQRMNKVVSIIDEIGQAPVLVFGNSSGDAAMAQYALQRGGKAYMLLCDDTERDYGDLNTAADFEAVCQSLGFETVSMRGDFATIYGEGIEKDAEE